MNPPDLLAAWQHAGSVTDRLFQDVPPHEWYARPIPERHRLIFYLGHIEAFEWNLLARYPDALPPFHASLDRLFAFGIDPPPGQLPQDTLQDWPLLNEVLHYRQQVRERLERLIPHTDTLLVHTAIEHRLMHAETFAYLLHQFMLAQPGRDCVTGPPDSRGLPDELIVIPGGRATLGQTDETVFGWDNEFAGHHVPVPPFRMGRYKVTNGQYRTFVEAGGAVPFFWTQRGGQWFHRGFRQDIPLPPNAPVYVTQEQAAAYAAWRGFRLPTEPEFHRAAYGTPDGAERAYPWGSTEPGEEHGNFDGRRWDPVPVDATPAGDSAFGIAQLVGNGWEWTSTIFAPFPGFAPRPFYPGYSADFFDGEHYVLKGASPRTPACFLRRSFRNWFRPGYPYVYGTFRLAGPAV